jgi:negative regulator of sigma E activity
MNFDDQLKAALKRREPPNGFAERVLARAQSPAARRLPSWRERWAWPILRPQQAWVAAGVAAAILLVTSGVRYQHQRQGELAKQQVMLALEIAGSKLNYVQKKTLEMGSGGVLENQ